MSESKELRTFFYHDEGQDVNGNFGPSVTGPGWRAVVGFTMDEAIKQLPPKAQKKISKELKLAEAEGLGDDLEEWAAQTCTWGWNFSIMDYVNWENELSNEIEPDPVAASAVAKSKRKGRK